MLFESAEKKKIVVGALPYERSFLYQVHQRLESTEKLLEPVPVIGFLTAKIVELLVGAQTRYTYMSGS
uniref:Uncharacterized protein n=1 Tax=Salix viminalis TaxID=40686 RepID=A0A6N2L981_SALVM